MKEDLLKYVDDYEFDYKNKLGLPNNVLFGLEIEYERLKKIHFTLPDLWVNKKEETIPDGGEINSNPMIDSINTWNSLKYVLDKLKEEDAKIYDAASGHLHFDSKILDRDTKTWFNFIKAWIIYEPVIYKFASGEKDQLRSFCSKYAFYLRYSLLSKYDELLCCTYSDELIGHLNNICTRCYGLCLSNVDNNKSKNTIEIRCPNGSLNPVIWQNNVDFFANFLLSVKEKQIDDELFKYRKKKYALNRFYDEDYLKEDIFLATELCDFTFSDFDSKVRFLKQYTKRF